jgi:hypothetical protein
MHERGTQRKVSVKTGSPVATGPGELGGPEAGGGKEDFFTEAAERAQAANTLFLDIWLQKIFCCFKPQILC